MLAVQEFDGASKRNPGPAGFGAVLYDELTGTEVCSLVAGRHWMPAWGGGARVRLAAAWLH